MKDVKVKICCIKSVKEASLAIAYGADAIGLVGPMPSGPGVLDNGKIRQIVEELEDTIETFLLTSETSANEIIAHYKKVRTSTIQLVDTVKNDTILDVKNAIPEVKIVQVIHVQDSKAIHQAMAIEDYVDAILLDSGNPSLSIKELGGTGRTHDWSLSKTIVDSTKIPVFLAGGIKTVNVRDAIETVMPYGIDLCSGVRTNDLLDSQKLQEFMNAVSL